jgi:hypothetical protein
VIFVLVVVAALLVAGFAFGHLRLLALPIIGWPLYFLGLKLELWGSGVGDFWALAMVLVTAASVIAVAAGVGLRRVTRRSHELISR